jgi:hypothetical protein
MMVTGSFGELRVRAKIDELSWLHMSPQTSIIQPQPVEYFL